MQDLLYPNNKNRLRRCNELTGDIATLSYDLSVLATDIQSLLAQLDATIRAMYSNIQVAIPASGTYRTNFHGWAVYTAQGIAPLIVYPLAARALERAAVSYLLRQGRIGEAAFSSLVGLPGWLKIGPRLGGFVVVVGIEVVIGAIAGAVKRDELRKCIHSCIQPRINMKKADMINGMLKRKLNTVKDSLKMMLSLGYTKALLDVVQQKISDQFKTEVSAITDNTAKTALAAMDSSRGSWTNEDY